MAVHRSVEYLLGREQVERELAARATDPLVAEIHCDLADSYAKLAAGSYPQSLSSDVAPGSGPRKVISVTRPLAILM